MKKTPFTLIAALLGLTLILTACDDDDDGMGPDQLPEGTVALRVVHASPDAPAVDVYAEGLDQPLFSDVAYGEVTDYLMVLEGTYNIQLRGAGALPSSHPVFETGNLMVSDGDVITAIATGFLSSMDAEDEFRVLPLFEDFADAGSSARVRIVHASPDAPTVAIDVANDGAPEIAALDRFEDTGADGVELPAGTSLQIGIWAGAPLARVTAFTTPALPAGGELLVIAIGSLESLPREETGFSLLAVAGSGAIGRIGQNPVVYALHAGPDAPAVDIFAGDLELVDNLSFAGLSGSIQVPPGSYTLDFFGTTAGSTRPGGPPAASVDTPQLEAGQRYLAIATGFLAPEMGEEAFRLVAFRDDLDLASSMARVSAIHASPDAPAVDIGTVNGGEIDRVVFQNVAYPEGKPETGADVPAAALTLGVAPTGSPDPVATFDIVTAAGLRVFAVAVGALAPDAGEESFRLVVVNTSEAPWTATPVNPN
ncbi:MAG: DUF4397 domain-containing protein [Gemmatimonadota bacterium]|nr:MAG: DUF4397 domain-containing protein [Gemmatimonadota bacterium]